MLEVRQTIGVKDKNDYLVKIKFQFFIEKIKKKIMLEVKQTIGVKDKNDYLIKIKFQFFIEKIEKKIMLELRQTIGVKDKNAYLVKIKFQFFIEKIEKKNHVRGEIDHRCKKQKCLSRQSRNISFLEKKIF